MKFTSQHLDWQWLVREQARGSWAGHLPRVAGQGTAINTHRDAWGPPHHQAAQLPVLRSADKCDQSSMDKLHYLRSWRREKFLIAHGWVTSQPRPRAAASAPRGPEEHAALGQTALGQTALVPGAGRGKTAAEAPDEWVEVTGITTQRPLLQLSWWNTALGSPPSCFVRDLLIFSLFKCIR